jgi:hypothetical protein
MGALLKMTMNSFRKNVLYKIKNLYDDLFHKKTLLKNREKINQYFAGNKEIFFGNHAFILKKMLLKDFVKTGQTFPEVNKNQVIQNAKENRASKIVSELKNKGYVVIENYLSQEICSRVVDYATNTPCFPRSPDGAPAQPQVEKINFDAPYLSARYDFSPNVLSIFRNLDLQDLMADPFLIEIAERYLSSAPYLDPVELWWFLPFPDRDDGWAEEYHFDFDSVRWLKFFLNFEDVEYQNGPHCFIEGTHNDLGIPNELRNRGYVRCNDEDVFKYVDSARERVFTAKAGTLLIEDTRGLHKGLTPSEGRRLLFSFQLSNYLFIDDSMIQKRVKPEFEKSDSFLKLWKMRPEFFSRYFT